MIMDNYVLMHHGILGQKWGVRRFQNPDGSLTKAGERRLKKQMKEDYKEADRQARREAQKKISKEYQKTTDYADKHGVDYDDVLYKDERKEWAKSAKQNGLSDSQIKHILKYNEMLDLAEEKEVKIWSEVGRNTVNKMLEKYGDQELDKYSKEYRAEKERISRLERG
jgi:hypothetical protein